MYIYWILLGLAIACLLYTSDAADDSTQACRFGLLAGHEEKNKKKKKKKI